MSEHPYIIFYDGVCGLCNRSVQIIIKFDKKEIFRFASLDSELAKSHLQAISNSQKLPDSIILLANNQVFLYSDALLKIVSLLDYPFKLLSIGKIVPKPLRDGIYKWIARNRYKIWGKYDSCPIPNEKQKGLFLENR